MTTIDHLQRIRARCVELLAIAEKRTPGEWKEEGNTVWRHDSERESFSICDTVSYALHSDALFIASCAGAAEAGWRSTIAAVDHALTMLDSSDETYVAAGENLSEPILAAWSEELL